MHPKHVLLAPLYLYQGKKLKRTALRLPEAKGKRVGQLSVDIDGNKRQPPSSLDVDLAHRSHNDTAFHLMMIGDSSAAGVGVVSQDEALIGQLLHHLQTACASSHAYCDYHHINWQLHATSGHTSFDVLRRLYVLPKAAADIDVMIIVVGVNDTVKNVAVKTWQQNIKQIITIAKRKFGAKHIVFSCLPPMKQMPALPAPLNNFIGAKAARLDKVLKQVCEQTNNVSYLSVDFAQADFENKAQAKDMFAKDGFHPNANAYAYWGGVMATKILGLIDTKVDG